MDIFPKYHKKEVKATKTASEEMWHLKKDLNDVVEILEEGYDCSRSKRGPNILERCVRRGKSVFKAVVVDCGTHYLVIHFGKFTYKKR